MNSTLGAPSRARTGAGQAGVDSSVGPSDHAGERGTRPILDNRHQDLSPLLAAYSCWLVSCGAMAEPASPGADDPYCDRATCGSRSGRMVAQ